MLGAGLLIFVIFGSGEVQSWAKHGTEDITVNVKLVENANEKLQIDRETVV